ncbi:transcriptional regulator [Bordetella genomosp. 13]|uniref:transcriptional regulator n=1 Tax=Bordetella genomosp. 13 TaxID=463040 RepID=UPI0011A42D30|nr:transcriptional regulator [Bordetella genomosp. 13]
MMTVIETHVFAAWAEKVWTDSEREAFVDWISVNPEAGDVIPGSGGCRKVRWTRAGTGKRGGARIIYYLRLANGELVPLLVYAKSRLDNISAASLAKMKEKLDAQEHRP